MSRYDKTGKLINNSEQYEDLLVSKNIKTLTQYSTFDFRELRNLQNYSFDVLVHQVEPFEKLYNISQKYYGDPQYGWLILYTNRIANEMLVKSGDTLFIYQPLNELLGLL